MFNKKKERKKDSFVKADSDAAAAGNAESEQTRMLFLDFLYNSIVNILPIYMYNIANVGWQLVHYTVYEVASSIITFLRPVNCIVDSPPSNICIMST